MPRGRPIRFYHYFTVAMSRMRSAGLLTCWICGTAEDVECHHSVVEFCLQDGYDWAKLARDHPEFGIVDDATFKRFVEGEGNITPSAACTIPGYWGSMSFPTRCGWRNATGSPPCLVPPRAYPLPKGEFLCPPIPPVNPYSVSSAPTAMSPPTASPRLAWWPWPPWIPEAGSSPGKNPEGAAIIILGITFDLTAVATGACSLDIGTTPTSATTASDNLIDGLDVHTATGVFTRLDQVGANGLARQKLAAGKWVTGSKDSGASAGLTGNAYIEYLLA
jgi:hypothetical protein